MKPSAVNVTDDEDGLSDSWSVVRVASNLRIKIVAVGSDSFITDTCCSVEVT